MNRHVFYDRREAGELLGNETARLGLDRPVVLGLPRGGVPVAAEVARAIGAPLDVIVVRKLGVPGHRELAMGAVGENDALVLNDDVVAYEDIDERDLLEVESRERGEIERRVAALRAVRAYEPLTGRSVVIVDDGVATGATVRAAILVARANGATDVTVAVPVAPPDVVEMLNEVADRVVCLSQPEPFMSVGTWYHDFDEVDDREVLSLLAGGTPSKPPVPRQSAPRP